MIKGVLLGTSIGAFLTSIGFFIAGLSGTLQENLITGAVVSPDKATSYSAVLGILFFFLSVAIFLVTIRRR
jgi:hypothetical protein